MNYDNILEAVGRTSLVRLHRTCEGLKPKVYAKLDYLNPGGSVKDRIAIRMIDEAERNGLLQPGGTIIEGTAGNTGMGLALVAAVRGYKLIFTITDKQSREKIDLLKTLGAEPRRETVVGGPIRPWPTCRGHDAGAKLPHDLLPGLCRLANVVQGKRIKGQTGSSYPVVVTGDAVPIEHGSMRSAGGCRGRRGDRRWLRIRGVERMDGSWRQKLDPSCGQH